MQRVLIVDDDAALRRLITRVVERVPGFEVAAEAADGETALALALENPPDIVLTDVAMPEMDGIELTRRLLDVQPGVRVVALTGAEPGEALGRMIRSGAVGYLVKTASIDEMIQALHAVARGLAVLSPEATSLVLKDLVQHYRAEQQRAESLIALDAMKRDFMNVISHELKTPVTIIKGGVQTLRRRNERLLPEQRSSFLDSIESQCLRLQRMIDQVLIVSQIERTSSSEVVDLADLIGALVTELAPHEQARIVVDVDPAPVIGRRQTLAQVVSWIVENALSFSEGPVRVATSFKPDGHRTLEIEDQGIGMEETLVRRVLDEPFTQLDSSMTRAREGLGLSLYAARQVLQNLGGDLEVQSQPGKGTTVSLRFDENSGRLEEGESPEEVGAERG